MRYYLERYAVRDAILSQEVSTDLNMVVVIPCYNEPLLDPSLEALYQCDSPDCFVEVLVVINAPEDAAPAVIERNKVAQQVVKKWNERSSAAGKFIRYYAIVENNLPQKHAGVGLARKIGMDEAVRRLNRVNRLQGIIVCFDADASCDRNYLVEIERHFNSFPKTPACSIHFEHPTAGTVFPEDIYEGIIQYELHLRYYKNGLAFAGLPYAYHTIGSSMAVRNEAYQKQNGMNKRKAGEDFYFLQKLIPLGNFSELKTTKVIPSPRVSDRVPFGTGKAIGDWIKEGHQEMLSYDHHSFVDLKQFCELVPFYYNNDSITEIPTAVSDFLKTIDFSQNLVKIRANSTSQQHFVVLFFRWFNAFKVLKYMHFARDHYYPNVPIFEGANELLRLLFISPKKNRDDLLMTYRELDLK